MKKPETLSEAFDLTKTHWREIIEWFRGGCKESNKLADIDWHSGNCGLCVFFRINGLLGCASCPLGSCSGSSIYYQFRNNPTIRNAELMLAEIERKENES